MKSLKTISAAITIALFCLSLSSFEVSSAIIQNTNQNATQIQLASNNSKVVDKVNGSATANYACMIGGLKKKQLYENAYFDMINKANLLNNSALLSM
jgi:hypothetical protein